MTELELIAKFVAFLGGLTCSIPFFRDSELRRVLSILDRIRPSDQGAEEALDRVRVHLERSPQEHLVSDLNLMRLGLGMATIAFLLDFLVVASRS